MNIANYMVGRNSSKPLSKSQGVKKRKSNLKRKTSVAVRVQKKMNNDLSANNQNLDYVPERLNSTYLRRPEPMVPMVVRVETSVKTMHKPEIKEGVEKQIHSKIKGLEQKYLKQ